jgi:phosphomannomutase
MVFDDVPGLEIVKLNFEHDGTFVHDPNPLVESNLAQTRSAVRETRADFGVCFDGDADRLMVVDEKADVVPCDMITALLVPYFLSDNPNSAVVYDLRSSRAVREEIRRYNGRPRRERVGHAFMKKSMADADAVFGGELSGHFYFKDNWYCDSGLLAFVHLLNLLGQRGEPLSALIKPLRRYAASGERNFQNENKDDAIKWVAKIYKDARIDYLDGITIEYADWWFNVRKSNTEPLLRLNLEAQTRELMEAKVAEVARHLGTPVDH